mmetsp:Transcript_642/g.1145  ORF Transcript_642/g.1145 Transcript_642/m.1145 type:complete len:844 (-) Transcript_642:337-2868(-)
MMTSSTIAPHQLQPARPSDLTTAMGAKFTRKRLFLILLLPAILTFLVPFALLFVLRILDAASSGFGMLSLTSACVLTALIVDQIRTLAPTPEKSKRAMEARFQIFVGLLVVCLLCFRGMAVMIDIMAQNHRGGGIHDAWGVGLNLGFRVGDNVGVMFNLALGVFLLGMIVGIRFLGPAAVVQCSTFPVPSFSSSSSSSSSSVRTFSNRRSVDGNAILDRFLVGVVSRPLRWLRSLVMPTTPLEQEQQDSWGSNSRRFQSAFRFNSSLKHPGTATFAYSTLPTHPVWHMPSQKEPKRYECPTLSRTILLLFLHGCLGALFAQCTILPLFLLHKGFHDIVMNHVVCSCALLSSFTFLATNIFAVKAYHELDMEVVLDAMKYMQHKQEEDMISMMRTVSVYIATMVWKQIVSCGFLFYWSITPFLCLGIIGCKAHASSWIQPTQSQVSVMLWWPCLQAIVISTMVTLVMSLYMIACDISLRIVLLLPGLNAHRFILMSGAKEQDLDVEDVMVEIILGGLGAGFLEFVVAPRLIVDRQGNLQLPNASSSKKRGYSVMGVIGGGINNEFDLEEEELRRNDIMTLLVQSCIEQGRICGHTTLEDDLLKVNLLESFGGYCTPGESNMAGIPFALSERHYREVARRILAPEPPKGTCVQQPPMVPVIRALSAYIGGIGTSLSTSSGSIFYISPCTKTTLEYAVNAASRFIVLNISRSFSSGGHTKKRFNRISLMTPVVLEAIYRLRCGIYDLACYLHEHAKCTKKTLPSNSGINTSKKATDNVERKGPWVIQSRERLDCILSSEPSLEHLVTVCDEAASCILKTVREVDGSSDFDAKVRTDGCRQWLISLD